MATARCHWAEACLDRLSKEKNEKVEKALGALYTQQNIFAEFAEFEAFQGPAAAAGQLPTCHRSPELKCLSGEVILKTPE